jgi:hypothetical protein
MPEMLMGFPSQSFSPDPEALHPFGNSCSFAVHFPVLLYPKKETDRTRSSRFEALIFKTKQYLREVD